MSLHGRGRLWTSRPAPYVFAAASGCLQGVNQRIRPRRVVRDAMGFPRRSLGAKRRISADDHEPDEAFRRFQAVNFIAITPWYRWNDSPSFPAAIHRKNPCSGDKGDAMWRRHELSVMQMEGQSGRLRMNGFKLIAPFRDPTIVTLGQQQDLKKFFL